MIKKYDLAVYIGRFQPIHIGHEEVLKTAKAIANKTVVLVGSANAAISTKNPFTYEERKHLILMVDNDVAVEPLDDFIYEENQWLTEVQDIVSTYEESKVCIIGHSKDDSSYYLKHFPQWDFVDVDYHEVIDATTIRQFLYTNRLAYVAGAVHANVYRELKIFEKTDTYKYLVEEYEFIQKYITSWANSPFPPTFNTVDAVVVQSGHILLVKRKFAPGKGLWALPGGFLNSKETFVNAVIRELREETRIKVPEPVLRGSIVKDETFDAPERSSRGRTITRVALVQLDDNQELPKVKGSDDAEEARFFTLAEFYNMAESMFEDHYHIIRKLVDNM